MYVCDPRRHHQHTIRSEKTRTSNSKCNRHRKDTIHQTKAWLVPVVACQCLCWSRDKFEDTKMIMNFTMPWIQISRLGIRTMDVTFTVFGIACMYLYLRYPNVFGNPFFFFFFLQTVDRGLLIASLKLLCLLL